MEDNGSDVFRDWTEEDSEFGMILHEKDPLRDKAKDEFQLRIPNMGKKQRSHITGFDRREPMVVYGLREATVHGSDSEDTPCSLVVFRWYLHQRERGKRLQALRIRIVFATTRTHVDSKVRNPWYDPSVRAVAPSGTYSLLPATTKVDRKLTSEGSLDIGFGGASAGAKVGYELSQSLETSHRIVINGTPFTDYRGGNPGDPDRCNGVEWNLFEDSAVKSGLPTFFRTAVLLERRFADDEEFTAAFTVQLNVDPLTDTLAKAKQLFGIIPIDEPVIFAPTMKEKNEFTSFSTALETVPLAKECRFVMYKADAAPYVEMPPKEKKEEQLSSEGAQKET